MRSVVVSPKPTSRAERLREQLLEQRQSIWHATRHRLQEVRNEGAADAGSVRDAIDLSESDIQADIETALLALHAETLVKIDDALARLDAGAYGQCLDCGHEIAARRLKALPFAVRCMTCEEHRETAVDTRPSPWRVVQPAAGELIM